MAKKQSELTIDSRAVERAMGRTIDRLLIADELLHYTQGIGLTGSRVLSNEQYKQIVLARASLSVIRVDLENRVYEANRHNKPYGVVFIDIEE